MQIFDQDGKFIDSGTVQPAERHLHRQERQPVCRRFRIKSVSRNHRGLEARHPHRQPEGQGRKVTAFIPDPDENATGTSAAEGVVVDAKGNVYGAEVGPQRVSKYVKK